MKRHQVPCQALCDFLNMDWNEIPWLAGCHIEESNLDAFVLREGSYKPKCPLVSLRFLKGSVVNARMVTVSTLVFAYRKWNQEQSQGHAASTPAADDSKEFFLSNADGTVVDVSTL